jgi:CheY-like chemotaxis protein
MIEELNPGAVEEEAEDLPTVLIVEDEKFDARLIKNYMSVLPCRVILAQGGKEALEWVAHEKIDVMLLDIMISIFQYPILIAQTACH